jgi:cytochrome P450
VIQPEPPVIELGPEYIENPYLVNERLRAQGAAVPVVMPSGMRAWLITRYAEARAALLDPRLGKQSLTIRGAYRPGSPESVLFRHMLNTDPPDHERLRSLVSKAFTARRIEQLRPRVSEITSELLDGVAIGGVTDLVEAFAFPLPITVICELLGLPAGDRKTFGEWSDAVVSAISRQAEVDAAAVAWSAYVAGQLDEKRKEPADDLLSALIQAEDSGGRLSRDELLAMVFLLVAAGHETTVNFIAGGILALLLNERERFRLRADLSLLPGAVDELLRYISPSAHSTLRVTREPVDVGGTLIPAGEIVLVSLSSANRDPARYPSPDRLDTGRDAGDHLGFGYGVHYCLGAPLARMEAEIAFAALLARFPDMTLAVSPAELRWKPSTLVHGPASLPVKLGQAG